MSSATEPSSPSRHSLTLASFSAQQSKSAWRYAILGGVLLLVVWALTFHLEKLESQHAHDKASVVGAELAGVYEAQMIHALREAERGLTIVAWAVDQQGASRALATVDERGLMPPRILFAVSIADRTGRVLAHNRTRDLPQGLPVQDLIPRLQASPRETIFIADTARFGQAGRAWIRFVRPILNSEQKITGYVVIGMEPSYLVSTYDEDQMGRKGALLLADHNGHVLAGRMGGVVHWGQSVKLPDPATARSNEANGGRFWHGQNDPHPLDKLMRLTTWHQINIFRLPLYVSVAIDEQEHHKVFREGNFTRYSLATLISGLIVLGVVAAMRVAQKIQVRNAIIRRIEQTYQAASEASPDASFVLDALLGEQGEVMDFVVASANRHAAELVSLSLPGLINVSLQQLLPPDRYKPVLGVLAQVYETGEHFSIEWKNDLPSIQASWLSAEAVKVPAGVVVLVADISARKEAEMAMQEKNEQLVQLNKELVDAHEQLIHSEKLASIGMLAAGVAHEINNPIGFVTSNVGALDGYCAQMLSLLERYQQLEAQLTPQTRQELTELKEQLEVDYLREDIPAVLKETRDGLTRVRKIVADLKSFSRVESTKEWQTVDIHQGIESTLTVVHNEVKYQADLVKEFGDLPLVECLPSELNQVIMNLVVNAAQAMGEQRGRIVIRTKALADDRIEIEVEDNGSGMSEQTKAKIFDPFFTTKPVGKGTGLGLSISYGIIQKHGGTITVDSEIGRGTRFVIRLPVHQDVAAAVN